MPLATILPLLERAQREARRYRDRLNRLRRMSLGGRIEAAARPEATIVGSERILRTAAGHQKATAAIGKFFSSGASRKHFTIRIVEE